MYVDNYLLRKNRYVDEEMERAKTERRDLERWG